MPRPSGHLIPGTSWARPAPGQCAGEAAALFDGGNREASMALFAFFFLFFFLVPSDTRSPLSLADSFPCFPAVALLVMVVAVVKSVLASFLAFFFNFLFSFFASFSTLTGPWMADSCRMAEADTAASWHRCHSSSLSSLLQGEGSLGQLGLGLSPKLPQKAPMAGGRQVESSSAQE